MSEDVQLTFISSDQEARDLWFTGKGVVKSRPDIIKVEIGMFAKSTGLATYTVFVWHEGRAWRFTFKLGPFAEAIYPISHHLERWYQAKLAGKSWPGLVESE